MAVQAGESHVLVNGALCISFSLRCVFSRVSLFTLCISTRSQFQAVPSSSERLLFNRCRFDVFTSRFVG